MAVPLLCPPGVMEAAPAHIEPECHSEAAAEPKILDDVVARWRIGKLSKLALLDAG